MRTAIPRTKLIPVIEAEEGAAGLPAKIGAAKGFEGVLCVITVAHE